MRARNGIAASLGRCLAFICVVVPLAAAATPTNDARLAQAVKDRDAKAVHALLAEHADVNARLGDGATALHWAAYWNDADTAKQLIRAGANVNATNDLGVTPLFLASSKPDATLASALLTAGADVDAADASGETPLMEAVRARAFPVVKLLLARGANVNATEASHAQTVLMWAAAEANPDIVQALLDAGADLKARSKVRVRKELLTISRQASYDPGAYDRYVKNGEMVEIKEGGFTPLLFAAQRGNVGAAKLLLAAGADVNDTAPNGMSALVIATYSDRTDMGKLLLEYGADPNTGDAGFTALHAAILKGNLDFVKVLLAHSASPNLPITKANGARRQSADYAFGDALVSATPIYLAARFGEVAMMHTLADAGADLKFAMPDGSTPMMAAMNIPKTDSGNVEGLGKDRRDRYVFFRRIKTESPDDFTPQSPEEIERDVLEMVRIEIAAGADVNAKDKRGDTVLHQAAFEGLNSVVRYLLDRGANINARNGRNQTPVDLAEMPRRNRGGDPLPPMKETAALLRSLGGEEGGVKVGEVYRRPQ